MIHSLAGISTDRFMRRDYYLAIACDMCGVTPQEVMDSSVHRHRVATARHAVIYALYNEGGITSTVAGIMVGLKPCTASHIVSSISDMLRNPKHNPLLCNVIKALLKNEN